MDIKQIRYFIKIVECGSLSKAAEQLYIAQPSLSLQIHSLESELNVQLLIRSPQGVTPTEAGKQLYRQGQIILRQIERIPQEIKAGIGAESGRVSVGLPTTMARILAYPLFTRIRSAFPDIRLHIFESESGYLSELLANGRLDIAVLFRDIETRGISVQPLLDEDLYLFGHIGSKLAPVADICPMRHLDGVPMVLNSASQGLRLLIDRSFARAGLELNVVAEIDSLATLMSIVQEGSACTILPTSVVPHKGQVQLPIIRRIVEPSIRRPVGLCWPTVLPPTTARIAVCRTIVDLLEQFVNDRVLIGATLRPLDRSVFSD